MTVPSSILLRPENRQAQTAADMATYACAGPKCLTTSGANCFLRPASRL